MCGFAGFKTSKAQPEGVQLLNALSQVLAHRGPDHAGIWYSDEVSFGMVSRRLSILDVSKAGNQPMQDHERGIRLIFNGEIYNYRELQKELESLGYRFTGQSDTQVLLYALHAWGMAALTKCDGMFAGAFYDMNTDELFLFRDRMGIKPLYFSLQGDSLSFASEIKALWKMPWITETISSRALSHYLTFLATPAPLTLFEGIYKLPAGYYARYAGGEIAFTQWYDPLHFDQVLSERETNKKSFCVQKVKDLLHKAVQKRMVSDVPVGALLSGGLDSSLIVALMAQYTKKLNTFTVSFEDDPDQERSWARKVAKKFGTNHHELILSDQDAFSFFEKMAYHQDEPLGDSVCIPLYYICKQARATGTKVLLLGEGSDELFCGYPLYVDYVSLYRYWQVSQRYLPKFAKRGIYYAARPFYSDYPNRQDLIQSWASNRALFWGGVRVFSPLWKKEMLAQNEHDAFDPMVEKIYNGFPQNSDSYEVADYHRKKFYETYPNGDFFSAMTYIELKHRLPELLLTRTDKMSMAASVEARVPFLDHRLVETMLQIPTKWKYHTNETKFILKKAAEGILPNEIIYRKKVGFASPVTRWFKKSSPFEEHLNDMVRSQTRWDAYLNKDAIVQLLKKNKSSSVNYSYQLWALNNVMAFQ